MILSKIQTYFRIDSIDFLPLKTQTEKELLVRKKQNRTLRCCCRCLGGVSVPRRWEFFCGKKTTQNKQTKKQKKIRKN